MNLVATFLTGLTGANTAELAERTRWTEDMKLTRAPTMIVDAADAARHGGGRAVTDKEREDR